MKPHMYLLNKYWEPTIVYPEEMKEGREKDYKTLSWWSLTGEQEYQSEINMARLSLLKDENLTYRKVGTEYPWTWPRVYDYGY